MHVCACVRWGFNPILFVYTMDIQISSSPSANNIYSLLREGRGCIFSDSTVQDRSMDAYSITNSQLHHIKFSFSHSVLAWWSHHYNKLQKTTKVYLLE
jgi:hypothetical protein